MATRVLESALKRGMKRGGGGGFTGYGLTSDSDKDDKPTKHKG